MSIEDNKLIVLEFWRRFSASDFVAAVDLLADDNFSWLLSGDPAKFPMAGLRNKAEMTALFGAILQIAPKGLQITPLTLTAEDNRVSMEAVSQAVTASGKHYSNRYHFLIELKDGKLQSVREYLDTQYANEIFCA